jgi:hypothetical protein
MHMCCSPIVGLTSLGRTLEDYCRYPYPIPDIRDNNNCTDTDIKSDTESGNDNRNDSDYNTDNGNENNNCSENCDHIHHDK